MTKYVVAILLIALVYIEYRIAVQNHNAEKELKVEMCKQLRDICDRDCKNCAWKCW